MCEAVYDKIVQDGVPDALKADIINSCAGCVAELGNDPLAVQYVFNQFSVTNASAGAPLPLNDGEIVGHIKLLRPSATYLSNVLSLDSDRVEELFRWLAGVGSPSPSQRDEAADWFDDLIDFVDSSGNALVISGPTCWLFREDTAGDANILFADAECLPCRLGLPTILERMPPYPRRLEFLGMCVPAASLANSRRATVFHGDYVSVRDIWLPGGMTQPIPAGPAACVAQGGLRELVADAPRFNQIDPKIRIFLT